MKKSILLLLIVSISSLTFAQNQKDNFVSIVKNATQAQLVNNLREANIDGVNKFQLSKFYLSNIKNSSVANQEQVTINYSFVETVLKDFSGYKTGDSKSFNDWTVQLAKDEHNQWEVIGCRVYNDSALK